MTIKVKTEAQERRDSFIQMIFWAAIWLALLNQLTGCMQLTGAKKITMGTFMTLEVLEK